MEIISLVLLVIIIGCLFNAIFVVKQQTTAVVERFGKFVKTASPGINIKIPFVERISGRLSMRIRQLDVPVETKTEDNVFVKVSISVQFYVLDKKEFEAFYKLDNTEQQITSYVFDVVRARVPKLTLDDLFVKKDDIADAVKDELTEITKSEFGKELLSHIENFPDIEQAGNPENNLTKDTWVYVVAYASLVNAEVVEKWAGIRPRASGREPLVGPLPGFANTLIADESFKISFAIAHLITNAVLARTVDANPAFLPDIFLPKNRLKSLHD